jgi:hypothetical protein
MGALDGRKSRDLAYEQRRNPIYVQELDILLLFFSDSDIG